MKKILLLTIVIASVSQARAQALFAKPTGSITSGFFKPFDSIKRSDTANYGKFFRMPDINSPLKQIKSNRTIVAEPFVSTMPVVKLKSSDRMPVAKLADGNTRYTMPVKKIAMVEPAGKLELVTP